MKKHLLFSLLGFSILCSNHLAAQFSIALTPGILKPTKASDPELGFTISGKYAVNEKIRVGINVGQYTKSYGQDAFKITLVSSPITGLFEYAFGTAKFSPYAGADLGLYRVATKGGIAPYSRSLFGGALALGLNYHINKHVAINSNAKYHYSVGNNSSRVPFIGFNAGILLSFGIK